MNETFKATMVASWTVADDGLIYKNDFFPWEDISDLTIINNPKPMLNGVYTLKAKGKTKNLAFSNKDKQRADKAYLFMKSKIAEADFIHQGGDPSTSELYITPESKKETLVLFQENNLANLLTIASEVISPTEILYVALKGAFKEYLFCTDKMAYIYKKGYMTGHTFGDGMFKMPYENITNAEVDYHLTSGYFELSSGGLQNKKLSYWSDKDNSTAKSPNAISIAGDNLKKQFEQAAHFIIEKSAEKKRPTVVIQSQSSFTSETASLGDEIRDLKALLDEDLITNEEFEAKKKQLLGL